MSIEPEKQYRSFPPDIGERILKAWRGYKEQFGLEGKLFFDEEGNRRPLEEAERDIEARRELIKEAREGGT